MKPIIMDMNEITLSKEVYDSRPNIFFSVFIYGLFAMAIIALIWTYFGELDVVVKANGTIRPSAQTAVIVNPVMGEVTNVFFTNGQSVRKEDILYVIDSSQLESEQISVEETIAMLRHEMDSLQLYLNSIEAGENLILDFDAEYSAQFDSFWMNLNTMEHNAASDSELLSSEQENFTESLAKKRVELEIVKLLNESITQGMDLLTASRPLYTESEDIETFHIYNNRYWQYVTDMENLKLQYTNQERDIINNTETARESLDGNSALKDAIESAGALSLPDIDPIYFRQYNEYTLQVRELEDACQLAEDTHQTNEELYRQGVVSLTEYNDSQTARDTARFNLDVYKTQYMLELDNKIKNAQNTLDDAEESLPHNQQEMQNAADKLRLDTLVSLGNQIIQLEDTIDSLENEIATAELQKKDVYTIGDEIGDITISRTAETNKILNRMKTVEQELLQHQTSLAKITTQIEASTVRAQIDGSIHTYTDVIKGSYLMSGTEIMAIIPVRDTEFNANIYINNQDIVSIEQGMLVKYNIFAMPQREYGEIAGTVTKISEDIISDANDLQGYYLVETAIVDKEYFDASGSAAELRVGMNVDARIITGRKKILFFLLEQLDLMIS